MGDAIAFASAPALLYTGGQWAVIATILGIGLALKAWVLWWLYQDTTWRGVAPWPWVGTAVVFDVFVVVVWLAQRPAPPKPRAHKPPGATQAPPGRPVASPRPTSAVEEERRWSRPSTTPRAQGDAYTAGGAFTSRTGQEETAEVTAGPGRLARVTCPGCGNRFVVRRSDDGATDITCEQCGASGRIA